MASFVSHPMSRSPSRGPARGFTMIELVMVLTIVSIVATLAVPRFNNAQHRYRAESAAQRVVDQLDLARRAARHQGAPVTLEADTNAHTLTIQGANHPPAAGNVYTLALGMRPYRARIVSAAFDQEPRVQFDGFGRPDNPGELVIAVGQRQRTVILSETGRAHIP